MDDGRLNTERRNFAAQRLYQAVQRELRSAIVWDEGQPDKSANRTDHDDLAGGLLPHDGKDRADHASGSKEVRIKISFGLIVIRVFERSCEAHAGASNQCI